MKYNKLNRIRYRMKKRNKSNLPRCVVFKSESHIYAQIIKDSNVVVSASSLEKDFKSKGYNVAGAKEIGKIIGQRAKAAGLDQCVFDRGEYKYTGRIAAIADGIREFITL